MGKSTKKKSKIKFLEQEEKFLKLYQEDTLVTEANYATICKRRSDFIKKLRNDKLLYIFNPENIRSIHEIELLLNIQRVLFQYDLLVQEMDKQLHAVAYDLYSAKDEEALRLSEEYVG